MNRLAHLKKTFPLQYGVNNPILRKVSDPVQNITPAMQELAEALSTLMREYDGVGLAAPQIGKNVRMVSVTQRDTSKKEREFLEEFVMINPMIIGKSDTLCVDEEACLSLPGETGNVQRPDSITVQFQTIDGKSHIHKADGYNARIIYHEIDHLDGILFVDKVV